jgi:hypothetical protein
MKTNPLTIFPLSHKLDSTRTRDRSCETVRNQRKKTPPKMIKPVFFCVFLALCSVAYGAAPTIVSSRLTRRNIEVQGIFLSKQTNPFLFSL